MVESRVFYVKSTTSRVVRMTHVSIKFCTAEHGWTETLFERGTHIDGPDPHGNSDLHRGGTIL